MKREWEDRRQGFPLAKDLRWRFAKDWNASVEKNESALAVDEPALGPPRPVAPTSKPAKGDTTEKPSSPTAADSKVEFSTDSPKNESEKIAGKSSQPEASEHWDGFWPLTVADLLHPAEKSAAGSTVAAPRGMDDGVRCLKRLAHADNLVGWNAAILWAQQDPASAVEVADILQRLIVNPPQYVVETADAPQSGNKDGSSRPKETLAKQPSDSKTSITDPGGPGRDTRSRTTRKTVSAATSCAAAEAWCLVLAASAADPIDGLAPAGRLLERTGLPNEIRAELFRGIARWVPPANIPRLENAFREGEGKQRPPIAIRRAAIDACLVYAIWNQPRVARDAKGRGTSPLWPKTVLNCRLDPDVDVRRTYIGWLGFAHGEEGFDLLKTQIEGTTFDLRRAALESLATLHSEQARAELRSQAAKSRDALRASAVQALAAWGLQDVVPYARDPSAAVRRAVAGELGKKATLDSAVILSELAVDRSTEVQLAAVRAATGWPDALAFPLFLHAMRDSSAKTRHEAAQYLSSRRKFVASYRFDSPSAQREVAVNAIASEVGSSLNYLDQALKREPRAAAEVNERRAAEVRAQLDALVANPADSPAAVAALEWLAGISARDVPVVESYLEAPTRKSPDAIYRDVLPKVSPVYAALVDLQSADVNTRRRGAKTLADRGQSATLSRPVLLRLREILSREEDDLVWRSAMTAVASDSTDECAGVANLALGHRSAEVRQLGCEYLARHGQPGHAVWLLDLLEDHSRGVQLAAIRALGNCGNQVAVRGLKPVNGRRTSPNLRALLTSSDPEVRFATATSLCRLGAAEGMHELVRLSYHSNPSYREQAVKEMGLSGQTRFVEHLITLGWTEQNDQVRQAILKSLDRLVPPENRPAAVGGTTAWDAKIQCWVRWFERQNGSPAQNTPAGAPLTSPPGRES